jgi:protein phosphatase methylesterase 1
LYFKTTYFFNSKRDIKLVVDTLWKDNCPPLLLVGHSMGGALAIHLAISDYIPNLIGMVVIDVVEGSAMDALSSMQAFLQGRPKTFKSIEQAIEYK